MGWGLGMVLVGGVLAAVLPAAGFHVLPPLTFLPGGLVVGQWFKPFAALVAVIGAVVLVVGVVGHEPGPPDGTRRTG